MTKCDLKLSKEGEQMAKQGMLVDVSKCTGCRACQVACKQWNNVPAVKTSFTGSYENPPTMNGSFTKVKFDEIMENGEVRFLARKVQCMHCTEASCIAVCAAGAISRTDNGHVVIDQDKCIGCKNCILACPFGAVGFNAETGTSQKCWECQDRLENGMIPACAKTCPPNAITFGTREELLLAAKARVEQLKKTGKDAYIYGEKELGGLGNLYVLDAQPETYGLPVNPKAATANLLNNWLGVLVGVGAMAVAPFWMVFRNKENMIAKNSGAGVDQDA